MKTGRASRQVGSPSDEPAPVMSRREIAQLTCSPKQLVCVEMLQEGNHRSFTELYSLLRSDRDRRAAAEPGSALCSQTPLEEQADKLQLIRKHLTRAEEEDRVHLTRDRVHLDQDQIHLTRAEEEDRTGACEQRLLLARLLSAPEDAWLRLHFLHGAEQDEGSRSSAERKLSLSEEYLKQGELHRARQQVELLLQQLGDGYLDWNRAGWPPPCWTPGTAAPPWCCSGGRTAPSWRVGGHQHFILCDDEDEDPNTSSSLFQSETRGWRRRPRSSWDGPIRAQGTTTQPDRFRADPVTSPERERGRLGDESVCVQFFNSCMQICGTLGDTDGLLEARMATAECLESEGSHDEAVQCLEEVVEITRSNGLQEQLAETYMHLGNNYYNRARCRTACDYFLQSCQAARDAGNRSLLEDAQVMVGVCRARSSFESYMADVASSSPSALRRLRRYEAAGAERDPDSGAEEG
ncbi:uncharacterized protein LOC115382575 [Salarias fasciatus]|uniref:uncharacterized protein LOC115382575 n=1 Tax=Salarias fasciatus TaxID=181472 RepID=UPI001176D970|nr:tetratricopeptide repeat protein 29 [Salarias fasciatus]